MIIFGVDLELNNCGNVMLVNLFHCKTMCKFTEFDRFKCIIIFSNIVQCSTNEGPKINCVMERSVVRRN